MRFRRLEILNTDTLRRHLGAGGKRRNLFSQLADRLVRGDSRRKP